jgi:hypothetical protein
VDAVNDDERGQALIVVVLMLAVAAATLSGLRLAQDRILAEAHDRRAGEAAVEAATAVIADAYTVARFSRHEDIAAAISESSALDAARDAAQAMSSANGGGAVSDVSARCRARSIDVAITLTGRTYRAGFEASCSPR